MTATSQSKHKVKLSRELSAIGKPGANRPDRFLLLASLTALTAMLGRVLEEPYSKETKRRFVDTAVRFLSQSGRKFRLEIPVNHLQRFRTAHGRKKLGKRMLVLLETLTEALLFAAGKEERVEAVADVLEAYQDLHSGDSSDDFASIFSALSTAQSIFNEAGTESEEDEDVAIQQAFLAFLPLIDPDASTRETEHGGQTKLTKSPESIHYDSVLEREEIKQAIDTLDSVLPTLSEEERNAIKTLIEHLDIIGMKEAVAISGLTRERIGVLIREKRIPAERVDGRYVIFRKGLTDFLNVERVWGKNLGPKKKTD